MIASLLTLFAFPIMKIGSIRPCFEHVCTTRYGDISQDVRQDLNVKPYAGEAYLHVQPLSDSTRFSACFGRAGTEFHLGIFVDARTAALAAKYAVRHPEKSASTVFDELNLTLSEY